MDLTQLVDQLQTRLKQGAANGLNATADAILHDIQTHVQVRTGNLRDSYAVTQRATPDNLTITVSSPLAVPGEYGAQQYPPVPASIPPERNRALLQGDPLFPADGDTTALQTVLTANLQQAIQQEF